MFFLKPRRLSQQTPGITSGEEERKNSFKNQKRKLFGEFLLSGKEIFFQKNDPAVSIIIILHNQAEFSYACLSSLLEFADVPFELIIVDNNSTDLTGKLLERIHGAKIVRNEENFYFLGACNQASQFVRGEYILFLNKNYLSFHLKQK